MEIGGCYVTAKRSKNGIERHSLGGVSKKFLRMSELYRFFARNMGDLDFSDQALLNLYNHESHGTSLLAQNGFAVGKKYLNVQVSMWREDIRRGWLFKHELYNDENFPHWWLDSILDGLYKKTTYDELLAECRKI